MCLNGTSVGEVSAGPYADSNSVVMYYYLNTSRTECSSVAVIVALMCTQHEV